MRLCSSRRWLILRSRTVVRCSQCTATRPLARRRPIHLRIQGDIILLDLKGDHRVRILLAFSFFES